MQISAVGCITCAILLLAACTTSKRMQGPSGGTAYFIKCGSARVDACYQKASNVCPNGYTFADRQANPDANTMLVECKP